MFSTCSMYTFNAKSLVAKSLAIRLIVTMNHSLYKNVQSDVSHNRK